MKKKKSLVLLLCILLLAIALRFVNLTTDPIAMNQDEVVNGYDAYSLAYTLRDHHGNFFPPMLQSFGDWASPALTYITVPFVRIMGLNVLSVRLPVAILGVLSVWLIYILIMQLMRRKDIALLGAFFMAIMPWSISLSRWAIPPNIVPFFLLLMITALLWVKDDTTKYRYIKLIPTILASVILTYSYPAEKLFTPVFLFCLCGIFFWNNIKKALVIYIPYLLCISPIYLLTLIDSSKYNSRLDAVSIFGKYHGIKDILQQFFAQYIGYFLPYNQFGPGDTNILRHVPGISTTYVLLALPFYFGVGYSIYQIYIGVQKERNKRASYTNSSPHREIVGRKDVISLRGHVVLLLWLLLSPVAASLTLSYMHVLRVEPMLTVIIIYSCIGIYAFVNSFSQEYMKKILLAVVIVIGIVSTIEFCGIYFLYYPHISKADDKYGLSNGLTYAIAHQNSYKTIYVDNSSAPAYIYYLFYDQYDPRKLNHTDSHGNIVPGLGIHTSIGKYTFIHLPRVIPGGILMASVTDVDGNWYNMYTVHGDLYILAGNWVKHVPPLSTSFSN